MKKNKSTRGVRYNPKAVGRPRKIGVERGYGPRHAENAKEGEDLTQVNTDTVPAMLTPREAVLNRNAAELAGRGNIEKLNSEGNQLAKRGVDLAAKGEEDVGEAGARKHLAGGGAQSARERQLWEKYGVMPPEAELYPDFYKLRDELGLDSLAVQGGTGEVPGLQGGTEKFMGPGAGDRRTAATTIGKWGDRLGPNSVAVSPADIASGKYQPGQWIQTPRGWKQVQDTSWVNPDTPNPAGTIEYWLGGKGKSKGKGGGGTGKLDMLPAGKANRKYRDLSTPASWGLGTQFFETPESFFSRATPSPSPSATPSPSPTPVPQGSSSVGQVTGDTGNVGFPSGTYTGELGGPGDPGRGGSNNPLDYLNPFGGTTKGGSGTGVPTQKAVGTAVGTVSNLLLPGSGFITGPLARWVTHLVQGGMSRGQAQQVAQQKVAQGKPPPMPSGSVSLPTGGGRGDAWHDASKQGLGGWGQPMGYFDIPNYMGIGDRGAPTSIAGNPSGQGTIANTGISPNDIMASGVTPRAVQSVGAPSGGFAPMGWSGPSNLRQFGGGWGDDARPHFNPYFGGFSKDAPSKGAQVRVAQGGDADIGENTMKQKPKYMQGGGNIADLTNQPGYGDTGTQYQYSMGPLTTDQPAQYPSGLLTTDQPTPLPYAGLSGGTPASYPFTAPGYAPQTFAAGQPGGRPISSGRPLPQRRGKYAARNSGFYPPGMGLQFASGTGDVGIGDPDPQSIGANFGEMPQLSAPNLGPLVAALMAEGKKQGLSAGQMQSILGAFQGMGGGAGSASDMATAATGAYQGGISDIGYPPFAAPNAEYHADKGSTWIGQYDPNIMIPRY